MKWWPKLGIILQTTATLLQLWKNHDIAFQCICERRDAADQRRPEIAFEKESWPAGWIGLRQQILSYQLDTGEILLKSLRCVTINPCLLSACANISLEAWIWDEYRGLWSWEGNQQKTQEALWISGSRRLSLSLSLFWAKHYYYLSAFIKTLFLYYTYIYIISQFKIISRLHPISILF